MPGSRRKRLDAGAAYVIDQSHRVVYLDRAAISSCIPLVDEWANSAECFRGAKRTVQGLPWNAESNEHATQSVIYSAHTGSWCEITCLELDWIQQKACVLFSTSRRRAQPRLVPPLSEPSYPR